jgi:hypothetical protein
MPGMSSISRVKLGPSLATLVEVISCTVSQERSLTERGAAIKLAEEVYYGKHRVSGSLTVLYDEADQTLIEDQIAGALAAVAMEITWVTGAVWSGPVKFGRHTPTFQTEQLVQATIEFSSDGAWIINGRNTETLATS